MLSAPPPERWSVPAVSSSPVRRESQNAKVACGIRTVFQGLHISSLPAVLPGTGPTAILYLLLDALDAILRVNTVQLGRPAVRVCSKELES